MKTQVIIAAAGSGQRLGMDVAKPFVLLKNKPLVVYALSVFELCPAVESMIIAANPDSLDMMAGVVSQAGLKKVKHIVAGGKMRSDSVKNALKALDDDTELVMIHDGARPLITVELLEAMTRDAQDEDGLICAVPVKPTIKEVDPRTYVVRRTLDRSCLWDIQTPQIFKRKILEEAYASDDIMATDDAALVERLGKRVRIFPGLERNIKITTSQDLFLAEKMLDISCKL